MWDTLCHILNIVGYVLLGAAALAAGLLLLGVAMLAAAEAKGENPFM